MTFGPQAHFLRMSLRALAFCLTLEVGDAIAAATPPLPTLTTMEKIRSLSLEEARRGYPVKVSGVVTYYELNPEFRAVLCFVQDETAGVYVHPGTVANREFLELTVGQFVEIEGYTFAERFAPYISGKRRQYPPRVTVIGTAPLPMPVRLTSDQLARPANDCQWIELDTVVVDIVEKKTDSPGSMKRLELDLLVSNKRCPAVIPVPEITVLPEHLKGASVRIQGVYGSVFNDKRQLVGMRLLVPDLQYITVNETGLHTLFAAPVRSIATVMQFSPEATDRVHVQGEVLLQTGQQLYIRDDSAGARILTPLSIDMAQGDVVDVVGYPVFSETGPTLENAIVRRRHVNPPKAPIAASPTDIVQGLFQYDLVAVEGLLLEKSTVADTTILLLQSGDLVFHARLPQHQTPPRLSHIPINSWVQASGVCVSQHVGRTNLGPNPRAARSQSFQLLMRNQTDIRVLRSAPWWTPRRLLAAMGLCAGLCCLALLWIVLLKRQVAIQSHLLEQKLQREVVMEERARIARELHDSLEQQLAAISIQLDAVGAQLYNAPGRAQEMLELANRMVRFSGAETKRAVWDLRSRALESNNLAEALQQLLTWSEAQTASPIDITTTGTIYRLPTPIAHNILRIGQEAITNAIQHGEATAIQVRLGYESKRLTLTVQDNGKGFDTESWKSSPSPHFGLLGMQERINKLKGKLEVKSAPGQGTTIRAQAPVPGNDSHSSETKSTPSPPTEGFVENQTEET